MDNNLVLLASEHLGRLRRLIPRLHAAGYRTENAQTVSSVWRCMGQYPYAVAILASPSSAFAEPWDLCRDLAGGSSALIILLFPGNQPRMRAQAYASRADQCFSLPGCSEELIAYLDAQRQLSRRAGALHVPAGRNDGSVQMDFPNRRVYVREREIDLTHQECALLELLARHEGKTVSYAEIQHCVWQSNHTHTFRASLKHCVMRLRRKLEAEPRRPRYLQTVRGLGYRLQLAARHSLKDVETRLELNGREPVCSSMQTSHVPGWTR